MLRQRDGDDPLLQGIADLRREVDRLIDEQIALVERRDGNHISRSKVEMSASRTPVAVAPIPGGSVTSGIAAARPVDRGDVDPKQRLDALARHLDVRLRRAREPSGDRPEPREDG